MKCVDSNSRYEPPIKDPAIQGSNPLSHPEPIQRERKREREKGGGGGLLTDFPMVCLGHTVTSKRPALPSRKLMLCRMYRGMATMLQGDRPSTETSYSTWYRNQSFNLKQKQKQANLIQKQVIQLETETSHSTWYRNKSFNLKQKQVIQLDTETSHSTWNRNK